ETIVYAPFKILHSISSQFAVTQPPLRISAVDPAPGCPLRADRYAPVYLVLKAGFALHSRAAYLHYVPVRSARFSVRTPKESVTLSEIESVLNGGHSIENRYRASIEESFHGCGVIAMIVISLIWGP